MLLSSLSVLSAVPARSGASSAEEAANWKPAPWGRQLEDELAAIRRSFSGVVTLYVADTEKGLVHGHDADKPSYLASCVKVAFMVEVFRQVARGELSLDEELTYGAEDIRDGATVVNPKPIGAKLRVRELLKAMIEVSDNAASDLLAKRVGLENINRGLVEEGFEGFTPLTYLRDVRVGVFREVDVRADDLSAADLRTIRWTAIWEPQVAKLTQLLGRPKGTYTKQHLLDAYDRFYATGVNSARLDTAARLLFAMVRGELVSPEASKEMIALLLNSKTSQRRILGRLPKGTKVAHKTGSQYERICDLGVIWMPDDAPLIFCACVAGGLDRNGAEDVLARLARKSWDLVLPAHARP